MKYLIFYITSILLLSNATAQEKPFGSEYNTPFSAISKNYTLIFTAFIDDCGEFGGHKETIELKKIDKKFFAEISVHDKNCDGGWDLDNAKKISSVIYSVSEKQLSLFYNYLEKLLKKTIKKEMPFHAGKYYFAKLEYNDDAEIKFKQIDLNFHDSNSEWKEFERLKKELKKN
jgi:hypothetical protein